MSPPPKTQTAKGETQPRLRVPYLIKRAGGRDISGLSAYEQ